MRLLSIGYPLPDPRIDNYTILNAPALFDYDAVLVDPAGVSAAIQAVLSGEDEMRSATDEPVLNASGSPLTAGLADLLRGRLAEAERTLARGGVIIVIGQPNVAIPGVAGFAGCDRYFWLPAPSGVHWGSPDLLMASGSGAIPADMTHPLAGLIDEYRARVRYRAHFASTPVITREGHLIARSPGGGAIGMEFRVGPGRIAFIPAPNVEAGPDRGPVASHLFDAARRMLELPPTEEAPSWVGAQSLPGLEQREAALEEARSAFEAAEARLKEAQSGVDALARFRRLLWCEGKFALEPVVFDALRLLGFETEGYPDAPPVLIRDNDRAFIEVDGAGGPVDMTPHYRLRERRERHLEREGELPRGLIIVNGERQSPPESRGRQLTEPLRIAAESMMYGILTSSDLFRLTRQALAGADEAWRARVRDRLLGESGVITINDLLSDGADGTNAQPASASAAPPDEDQSTQPTLH